MRGGDSSGIRAYNERLVLSAILDNGSLSKAQLSRMTGLSANAAMVIANRLIEQGFLVKGDPVRGQVGQPSIPIAVNPEGAYSIGVKVGRRSIQSLLIDFMGNINARREMTYAYPEPGSTVATAIAQCTELLGALGTDQRDRIVGIGIALPGDLDAWTRELGAEPGALAGWREADIAADLTRATGLDVTVLNDASAACAAEMILGQGIGHQSALYLYFGTFIGGGIVLDGRLYLGESRNAGAIGSMPAGGPAGRDQLIHCASLLQLENLFADNQIDAAKALAGNGGASASQLFEHWLDTAAPAVAQAITAALGVIDFQSVVVDGNFSTDWRGRLKDRISTEMQTQNLSGLTKPELVTGSIGASAPAMGAAMMPLRARFAPHPELLVRTGSQAQR